MEINKLKNELDIINGNMQEFAQARKLTVQAKKWMRQVRETAYDIEDWVDDYFRRSDPYADKHVGAVQGLVQRLTRLQRAKDQLPNSQIKEFTELIKEANDRYQRYELKHELGISRVHSGVAADRKGVAALHAEETGLVGIDKPAKDVLDRLHVHDEGPPHLKVVFLVGPGGLGKTTLAKEVWRRLRLQRQFKHWAFVHAGRNPSVKTVLMNMFEKVKGRRLEGSDSWDETRLIDELNKLLGGEKYFIVIDDVWSSTIWQVIKCALPQNNSGSRVIISTRNEDMANSLCLNINCVYKMEPLSRIADQEALFYGSIIGPGKEKECLDEQVAPANDILNKCGGVPLAIIVMAGLLASRDRKTWTFVRRSFGNDQEEVEEVRKILYFSYTDLPNYLKSCFLYLSVFPEGYVMRKDRVIRRWIAEGFIGKVVDKSSSQENGESCFDELINRGLVQPLPPDENGGIGYVVHDLVRDLIISMSAEENFVTVSSQLINAVPHDKIRRLSLQYNNQQETPTMPSSGILSSVRSLTVFGRDEENHDPAQFRFLRVLDLEDADVLKKDRLQSIHKLFQLKYLGLGVGVPTLPKQIEVLENLETLDIRRTGIRKLAVDGRGFRKLAHLLATDVELPSGVGSMQELQELSMVEVNHSSTPQYLQELGKLEKLRILGLKWSLRNGDKACEESLVEALKKLGGFSLKSLCLDAGKDSSLDFLMSWEPSRELGEFKLACSSHYYFPRLPTNMAHAINVVYLEIGISKVEDGDLDILSGLPKLTLLKLRSRASSRLVIGSQGFSILEEFWFESRNAELAGLVFKKGAMPKLWKLRLRCDARSARVSPELGLTNLASLKLVRVKMEWEGADGPAVEAAEKAITAAAKASPTCRLEITV